MVYEHVFRELPFAVALVDGGMTVRDATPAFAESMGVTLDRLIGASLTLDECAEAGAETASTIAPSPCRGVAAIGTGRRLQVSIRAVSASGEALALVTVEEPGERRMAELVDSLRALKHEMNNPLTGALGNINLLLRRGDLDERARRRLTTAEQEIKKVSLLVMRLSELSPFNGTK